MTAKRVDHGVAARAAQAVRNVPPDKLAEFASHSKGLPVMLLTSGLANTVAYLDSKGKAQALIAQCVIEDLGHDSKDELLAWLSTASNAEARQATVRARQFADWLRRRVDAK